MRLNYMATLKKIRVEVAYATPTFQEIIALEVVENSTLEQVILQSKILEKFPEINLAKQKIGVFSKQMGLMDFVHEGDRIEIYRPLTIHPREARRARVKGRKS